MRTVVDFASKRAELSPDATAFVEQATGRQLTFATFNEAYIAGFGDSRPARSTIAVAGLPIGAQVEIEAWAYKPE